MDKELKDLFKIKVSLIPEEGIDGQWELPAEIFAEDTHPLPVEGAVRLEGRLYKAGGTVYLQGRLEGSLSLSCSRCLKLFRREVESEIVAVFMPRESLNVEDREVELAGQDMDVQFFDGDEIDLYEPVRDQMALSAPMSPLCDEECKGLCPMCGANLNETECECRPPAGDPRLAVLRNLKLK